MSLGIPAHLAPVVFAKALSRLFLVYSAICLIIAEILYLVAAAAVQSWMLMWAGLSIGVPGLVLLYAVGKSPSLPRATVYLATGAASLAFCTYVTLEPAAYVLNTTFTPLAFISFALVMTCASSTTTKGRMVWLIVGYATTQVVLIKVSLLMGKDFLFDYRVLAGTIIAGIAIVVTPRLLAKTTKKQAAIEQSTEVAQAESYRTEITREATMNVHDTLLATLSALSLAKPGSAQPVLRQNAEKQLANLHTANWVGHNLVHDHIPDNSMWTEALLDVIDEIEQTGLQVNMTGQADAMNKLSENMADALLAALKQCLTNVQRHSGQSSAEVVVLATEESVTVTVIDSGIGFDKDAVPEDRLGLRLSVYRRIEDASGTVNVWTGPGLGTAVMLKVPIVTGGGF